MKKLMIILWLSVSAITANGQTGIDSVLISIAKNNKSIIAGTKYWEARKLEFQTGLTPPNPKVDYDYMIGTPANAGNQTDFAVTQSFDFPTVYAKKKQLSNEQLKQAEFQLTAQRQEILLQSKLVCIELIYRNKLHSELAGRKQKTENWLSAFQRSLEKGEGNMMDVNKAKLQLIEINAAYQENLSARHRLQQKLTELNGGMPIEFSDSTYTSGAVVPGFENLENEIEAEDPVRKYLEQEKVISKNEIALSKSLKLPKIETGYHYQAILGQRFNGVHFGLTIPLWENKNTVKTKQAELVVDDARLQDHINEHYFEIKQKYERMTGLKTTLDEYRELFASLNNVELLDKSLALGQISAIEYFMETAYYYQALKNYLKTEMEYHMVLAELYKYRL